MKRLGKVFAVIGGARDVGAAIVRELGKKIVQGGERGIVHFTSRPENMYCAKIFEEKLRREFCNNSVTFRASELDIGSRWSIENFQRKFKTRHGYLDIVINNAAVYRPPDEVSNDFSIVERIVKANHLGTKLLTKNLLPLMSEDSKMIFISSHLSEFHSGSFYPGMNQDDLDALMEAFILSFKDGTYDTELDLPPCLYSVSKRALNEYTPLLQEYVDVEYAKIGISVNAICPGTKHYKMRNLLPEEIISDEEAGKIIINLATRKKMPKGQVFWHTGILMSDRKAIRDTVAETVGYSPWARNRKRFLSEPYKK